MEVVKEGKQRECEKAGLHHTAAAAAAAAVRVCVAFRPQLPRLAALWMAECTARLRCCAVLRCAVLIVIRAVIAFCWSQFKSRPKLDACQP